MNSGPCSSRNTGIAGAGHLLLGYIDCVSVVGSPLFDGGAECSCRSFVVIPDRFFRMCCILSGTIRTFVFSFTALKVWVQVSAGAALARPWLSRQSGCLDSMIPAVVLVQPTVS